MRQQPQESSDVRLRLEEHVSAALAKRGWWPPEDPATRHHVTWKEVAAVAVDVMAQDLAEVLGGGGDHVLDDRFPAPRSQPAARPNPSTDVLAVAGRTPWLDTDEVAPLLNVTPHTLRRLAREDRCPIVVRRIGGRWRFARQDLERYLGVAPSHG